MTITLTSGMRQNLFALQQTDKLMSLTQTRLATGKKVNTALDDPVNFFRSKAHMDRANDLSALKDGMSEAIKVIEAADTGIESMYDLLAQMESVANAAKTSSNPTALEAQYDELLNQFNRIAVDSGYGGKNLLQAGNDLTVQFNEDGLSTLTVTSFDTAGSISISAADFSAPSTIDTGIAELNTAKDQLRVQAQTMSSNLSTISIRADFTEKMINTLETGADQLVLADMNEEGANMLMLETRQALGTTALSLSSQAAQSVLRLF